MLTLALTSFLLAPQQTICPDPIPPLNCDYTPESLPAHQVDLIMNGEFEHLSDVGEIAPGVPADGAFWNGAESFTYGPSGPRVLRFPAQTRHFVYQRVAADANQMDQLGALKAKVRIGDANDEVQVTVSEGSAPFSGYRENFPTMPGFAEDWTFAERIGGSETALTALENTYACQHDVASVLGPFGDVMIHAGASIVMSYEASYEGYVRVVVRPRRSMSNLPQNSVPIDATVEKGTPNGMGGFTTTTISTWTIDGLDGDGEVLLDRVRLVAGETLRLVLSPQGGVAANLKCEPVFAYEGRGVTYRFTDDPAVPATATELLGTPAAHLYVKQDGVQAGSWRNLSNDFVQDWTTVGGSDSPGAPLDIRITTTGDNSQHVQIDGIRLSSAFSDRSRSDLREAILDELRTMRDTQRKLVDRAGAGGPGQVGALESPYSIHRMRLQWGLAHANGGCWSNNGGSPANPRANFFGDAPDYLGSVLALEYDELSSDDVDYMAEQALQRRSIYGPTAYEYDCKADEYTEIVDDNVSLFQPIRGALARYHATNDPMSLDQAFEMSQWALAVGGFADEVYEAKTPPIPSFLIRIKGYDINDGTGNPTSKDQMRKRCDGSLVFPDPQIGFWERMHMPSAILRTYVACREFNEVNFQRYAGIDSWIPTLRLAVETVERFHHQGCAYTDATTQSSESWGGSWSSMGGVMNDNYGYHGQNASAAWEALNAHPAWISADADLKAIRDALLSTTTDDIVTSGAEALLDPWDEQTSRGASIAGDGPRGWENYSYLVDRDLPSSVRAQDYVDQLVQAALHSTRFQVGGGVWTSGGNHQHHYKNFSSSQGSATSPPEKFIASVAMALRHLDHTDPRYTDLVAVMSSHLESTREYYKRCFGYIATFEPSPAQDNAFSDAGERFLGAMTVLAEQLTEDMIEDGELPAGPGPSVSIGPDSFSTAPPMGQQAFTFSIHLPGPLTQSQATDAVEQQVKIVKWEENPAGPGFADPLADPMIWTPTTLWPDDPNAFNAPTYLQNVDGSWLVKLVLPSGGAAGDGQFKYTIRAWDELGIRSRDTSYQPSW